MAVSFDSLFWLAIGRHFSQHAPLTQQFNPRIAKAVPIVAAWFNFSIFAGDKSWVAGVELATASEPPARKPRIWGRRPRASTPATPRCNLLLNHAKKRDAPVDLRAFPWSLWPSLADAIDTPYRLLQDAQEFRPADESR